MAVQPTTLPSSSATHRWPGSHFVGELVGGRDLGLERRQAGRDALGVDEADGLEVGVGHGTRGDVGGQVLGAARPRGEGAHDDVGCVGEAGAAGGVDRDDAGRADLVDLHEAHVGELADVVGAGGLADPEGGRQVADLHGAGRPRWRRCAGGARGSGRPARRTTRRTSPRRPRPGRRDPTRCRARSRLHRCRHRSRRGGGRGSSQTSIIIDRPSILETIDPDRLWSGIDHRR